MFKIYNFLNPPYAQPNFKDIHAQFVIGFTSFGRFLQKKSSTVKLLITVEHLDFDLLKGYRLLKISSLSKS
ncbi:hypothetical protein RIR_jg3185.t1 [Rhizophagus irregularis DAOM 181602=DAOM 197198]|nr:hypothetical protein RIR_jg3185.t1 [Rhizophagus irregularis DAOM 181602=DAOM 197198]